MAGAPSRISTVLVTRGVGPVRGELSPRPEGARLHGTAGGLPATAGGPVQPLPPGEPVERRPGRRVPRLAPRRGAAPVPVVRARAVRLLDVLRELGCWRLAAGEPVRAGSPAEVLLAGFGRYLAVERSLAASTVQGYVSHARRFWTGCRPASAPSTCPASMSTHQVLAPAPDPTQRARLEEIRANLHDRIAEAERGAGSAKSTD